MMMPTTPQPPPRPRSLPPIPTPTPIITMIDFDLQGYIDNELASGNKDIIIPLPPINPQTGIQLKYRITPKNKHHLLLKGLNGVTITTATAANYGGEDDPSSIELICTETTRVITLLNCTDVTIKGFIIDYDPLPYTQGYIVGFGGDKPRLKLNHEIELSCGQGYISSNHYIDNYKYEIYQSNGTLRYGSYFGTKIKKDTKSPSRFTVTIPERYSTSNLQKEALQPQIGDIIVIGCTYAPTSNGHTLPHAICCMGCNNIKFENITMYSSNNFGFFEKNCYSTSYIRCIIDRRRPRPQQPSLLLPVVPRMRSLNADAFHSSCARKGPHITGCIAKYMGDDGINIHGEYHMITKAKVINNTTTTDNTTSPTRTYTSSSSGVDKSKSVIVAELRVLSRNKDDGSGNYAKINIDINDPVEIMTYNGENLGINDLVATNICLDDECPEITNDEKIFFLKQKLSNDLKTNKGGSLRTAYKITIEFSCYDDKELLLPLSLSSLLCIGSAITSKNKCGNNFKIISNEFGYTRSRGIIVKSSNGIISNNTMMNCVGESIRIAPGNWWLESGNSSNIKIQDNLICNCSSYGIGIYSFGSDNTTLASSAAGHNNIMIRQNTVSNCPIPNILVTSATNVNVKNNQCRNVQKDVIANGPPNMNSIVKKEYDTNEKLGNNKTTMIINCSDVNAN